MGSQPLLRYSLSKHCIVHVVMTLCSDPQHSPTERREGRNEAGIETLFNECVTKATIEVTFTTINIPLGMSTEVSLCTFTRSN